MYFYLDEEPLDQQEAWQGALAKMSNWTAPGLEMLFAYWLKAFPTMSGHLRGLLLDILNGELALPQWFVTGRTVLVPKEGCTGQLDQFRPITCLNTTYKLLTGTVTAILYEHVEKQGLLLEEQKALRKGRLPGCPHHRSGYCCGSQGKRVAVKEIGANLHFPQAGGKPLSVEWIDYRKAVPHKVIRKVLRAIRAPRTIRKLVEAACGMWRTEVCVRLAKVDHKELI